MKDIELLIKQKMTLCLNSICNISSNEMDKNEAEAVERLARALSYVHQIKEKEEKENEV